MGAFLFYLLKSGCCLVVFYIFFKLLMSRSTFFRFNRITLLVGLLGCTLLPLIELTTTEETFLHTPLYAIHEILQSTESVILNPEQMEDPILISEKNPEINSLNWIPVTLAFIYGVGALVTLIWLSLSTCRLIQLIRTSEKKQFGNYVLVIPQQPTASFSWGKYIVISAADYSQQSEEILLHETMHLRNHHTLDLLFMQIFLLVYWFNPVVWLLKRELQEVHEFEADNGVINTGIDATKYQLLLVKKAAGARLYSIANSFNHSKLKNRITMMLKEKSNQWARLKVLLFILPTTMLMLAFARPATALLEAGQISEFKVIQIPEENQSNLQNVEKKVKMESVQDDSTVVVTYSKKIRISKSDSSVSAKYVVVNTRDSQDGKSDSSGIVSQEKGKVQRVRTFSPPPPPVPLVFLMYTEGSGKKVSLGFSSEKEVFEKLNTSDFREAMKFVLQVNRQRDDELQKRIIGLLKEKGVEGDISVKKGTPPPPLAPLQMTFVYNSGQKMYKDVWQVSNAESFIDHTPVDRVKEVILNIAPKCKDEMKKSIRDYLAKKGFTQISERQLKYN